MQSSKVLEAALNQFAATGVDGSSMQRIAEDVGSTPEELCRHYESIDVLFDRAMAWGTSELCAELHTASGGEDEPVVRLARMIRSLAGASGPAQAALFAWLRELMNGHPRAERVYAETLVATVEELMSVIGEGQFRGQLDPLPPHFVLASLVGGIVFPQLIGYGAMQAELGGVHTKTNSPGGGMLAAGLQALFRGVLTDGWRPRFGELMTTGSGRRSH